MGPIKALKKRKRSAEKKADPNVLLAAASAATDSLHNDNNDNDDDSSQPSDWWDGFSRRISGILLNLVSLFCIGISGISFVIAFQDFNGLLYLFVFFKFVYRFRSNFN